MAATITLGFAIFFTIISVVLLALSFSTDHWVETQVNRAAITAKVTPALDSEVKTNFIYFTRHRGLFRTCFPGNETAFLDSDPDRTDGSCVYQRGYELSRRPETVNWGEDYNVRIHLLRAHFSFFVIAMFMMVLACIIGAFGCWNNNSSVLQTSGLLMFLGGFFCAGGMAFFHGYEYLEKRKILQPIFPAMYADSDNTEFKLLQENSSVNYGYSYIVGWLAMGIAAISAVLYMFAASDVSRTHRRRRDDDVQSLKRSERNRAYNYYPEAQMQPQPQPQKYVDGYGNPYAGYDMSGYSRY